MKHEGATRPAQPVRSSRSFRSVRCLIQAGSPGPRLRPNTPGPGSVGVPHPRDRGVPDLPAQARASKQAERHIDPSARRERDQGDCPTRPIPSTLLRPLIALFTLLFATSLFAQTPAPTKGDHLAPFSLPRQSGPVLEWKPGKKAIITVVAYWCDTWKQQLKRVAEVQKSLSGTPCDFIVVSVDGRWSELGPSCPWGTRVSDGGATWSGGMGIDRVPFTMAVDETGTIRSAWSGIARSADMVRAIREEATTAGTIYLTFDDFPSKTGDNELLDILRKEEVPATFFCIGTNVVSHPDVVARAAREGHGLGMHAWAHDASSPELEKCSAAIKKASGITATLYRPPGSSEILENGKAKPVRVVDAYDYRYPDLKELLRRLLNAVRSGCVVQLHAGVRPTREALSTLIAALKKRGFVFARL